MSFLLLRIEIVFTSYGLSHVFTVIGCIAVNRLRYISRGSSYKGEMASFYFFFGTAYSILHLYAHAFRGLSVPSPFDQLLNFILLDFHNRKRDIPTRNSDCRPRILYRHLRPTTTFIDFMLNTFCGKFFSFVHLKKHILVDKKFGGVT
jgi:hypothetical protein